MSKTASMVMKIIGASLALAAVVCLLIGGWHDLSVGCCGVRTAWQRNSDPSTMTMPTRSFTSEPGQKRTVT